MVAAVNFNVEMKVRNRLASLCSATRGCAGARARRGRAPSRARRPHQRSQTCGQPTFRRAARACLLRTRLCRNTRARTPRRKDVRVAARRRAPVALELESGSAGSEPGGPLIRPIRAAGAARHPRPARFAPAWLRRRTARSLARLCPAPSSFRTVRRGHSARPGLVTCPAPSASHLLGPSAPLRAYSRVWNDICETSVSSSSWGTIKPQIQSPERCWENAKGRGLRSSASMKARP